MARAKSSKASTSKASKSETKSQAEGETKQKSKAKAKGATAAKAQTKAKSAAAGRTKARREKPDVIGTVGPTGAAAAEMGFASGLSSGFGSNETSGDFMSDGTPAAAAAPEPEPASR